MDGTVSIEEFESLQGQLLQLKTDNYDLHESLNAAKQKSSLSPQQLAEQARNDNGHLRKSVAESMKERDALVEQLKLVKVAEFLRLQNLYEATSVPDISTIPSELRDAAIEVFRLMDDVKQQIVRRAFIDTQLNELGKRSKNLSRLGEQLQIQIDSLRLSQKTELSAVDESRDGMQNLEADTGRLRSAIQAATPRASDASPDDFKMIARRTRAVADEIDRRRRNKDALVERLREKVAEYDRKLDDAESVRAVIEKKTQQRVSALQTEINRRRGIIVHGSKTSPQRDVAQLFVESKALIAQIAEKQEEIWSLDERVSFSRNSLRLLADDILKKMLRRGGQKTGQMNEVAHNIILTLAVIDRKKNEIVQRSNAAKAVAADADVQFDQAARMVIAKFAEMGRILTDSCMSDMFKLFIAQEHGYTRSKFASLIIKLGAAPHFFGRILALRMQPGGNVAGLVGDIRKGFYLMSEFSRASGVFSDGDERRAMSSITRTAWEDLEALEAYWSGAKKEGEFPLRQLSSGKGRTAAFYVKVKVSGNGMMFYNRIGCFYDNGSFGYVRKNGKLRLFAKPKEKEVLKSQKAEPSFRLAAGGETITVKFKEYGVVKRALFGIID